LGILPKVLKNHWISFFLYSILTLFFLQDWVIHFSHSIIGDETGDGSLTIWIAYWPYLKIKSYFLGETLEPYLNSNIFYGFEGAYSFSDMMPSLVFFVAILDSLFHNPILTINLIQIFFILLLPFGSYYLLHTLGYNHTISFISGLLVSFTSFQIHHYLHFQLQFASLIPIGLAYFLKFLKRPNPKNISKLSITIIFLAGVSSHIFLYLIFSIFTILTLLFFILILNDKLSLFSLVIKRIFTIPIISILFSSVLITFVIIYPYYANMVTYNFKRQKVDTLLYSIQPLDLKSMGFHTTLYLILILSVIVPFLSKSLSESEKLKGKIYFFLCLLFYSFALGAKRYYPYTWVFVYFPGFSGIRDSSRILYLFWISFSLWIGFLLHTLDVWIHSRQGFPFPLQNRVSHPSFSNLFQGRWIDHKYLFHTLLFILIFLDLFFLWNRQPQMHRLEIPEQMKRIHQDYAKGVYQEPLLIVSNRSLLTSYTDIDAYSQYLSIFHKKKLVGGYSGQYPYSLFMLRLAISSYLSGESQWKKEEIETVLASSPVGSIAMYDVPEEWKNKLSKINANPHHQKTPCGTTLKGNWRNLSKISPNYGLILGYTPYQDFCINPYNKILDKEVILKWIKEEKVVYTDKLYINSPFYHHPSAPEMLYNTEGFRDRGEYTLQLFQEEEMLYTGQVLVQ
jgi:hypothetical protein